MIDVDRLVLVAFGHEPERVGADPQIHVHGHEDRRTIGRCVANLDRGLQDRVVARRRVQRDLQLGPPIRHEHAQRAAVADLHAARQRAVLVALRVEQPRDRARVSARARSSRA